MSSAIKFAAVQAGPYDDAPENHMFTLTLRDGGAPKVSPYPGIGTPRELDNDAPLPTSTSIVFQQTHITSNLPTLPERPVPERSFSLVAFLKSPVPLSAPCHSALK